MRPAWSPDGMQVAFDWAARRACEPGTKGTTSIYVAGTRGGGARRLRSVEAMRLSTKRTSFYQVLDWSPDGRRLLFGTEVWRTGGDCGVGTSGDQIAGALGHIGVAGGRPSMIPSGDAGQGDWSPDGELVAFCEDGVAVGRRSGLVIRRWPGHYSQSLGCGEGSYRWLVWSHDGQEVYAATDDRVVALRLSDGRQRTLFNLTPIARCSADFNCFLRILSRSQDGRSLLIQGEGGRLDTDALFVVQTDSAGWNRLPDSYRKAVARGAALRLS